MEIATSLVALASKIFEFINTKSARQYIEELKDVQEKLLLEREKGDEADDGYIEHLFKRIVIIKEAAEREINLLIASRK